MNRWFAIRSKPRKEFYAKENLERQGHVVYLPVVRKRVTHARKQRVVSRPFFSGYLFARLNPASTNWTAVNSTYGVAGVVRFGDQYPEVPHELIEQLRSKEDETGHIILPEELASPFTKGARVAVKIGEADIEGIFFGLSGEDRARILIELLKKRWVAEVPLEIVSPL